MLIILILVLLALGLIMLHYGIQEDKNVKEKKSKRIEKDNLVLKIRMLNPKKRMFLEN